MRRTAGYAILIPVLALALAGCTAGAPPAHDPHRDLCAVDVALEDPAQALAACERAISVDPDDAEIHFLTGQVRAALGEHELALRSFDEALSLRPNHRAAHRERGISLDALERYDEALAAFDESIPLGTHGYHDVAHFHRAGTLVKLGNYTEALSTLDRFVESRPDHNGAEDARQELIALMNACGE